MSERQPDSFRIHHSSSLAYVDCFSGISGDMLLGALVDAGLRLELLEAELARLPLAGYRLEVKRRESHGLSGAKLEVVLEVASPSASDSARRRSLPGWPRRKRAYTACLLRKSIFTRSGPSTR